MSWYKLAKDYVDLYQQKIQEDELKKFTNSPEDHTEKQLNVDESKITLENALDLSRNNKVKNPFLFNEAKQPIRTKANGQGADGLLQANRDIPIYSDNFINTSDWNSN